MNKWVKFNKKKLPFLRFIVRIAPTLGQSEKKTKFSLVTYFIIIRF